MRGLFHPHGGNGWDGRPFHRNNGRQIGEFGSYMFGLASPTVSDIDEIKYGGRLVILQDGTRWEVDQYDSDSVEYWSTFSKVAVLDDVMYVIEDAEHASVSQET